MSLFLTKDDLQPIFDIGGIVDATKGGLVLGNFHAQYGVKMIRRHGNGLYELIAECEGWEYIMNPRVTEIKHNEIEIINRELSEYKGVFEEYKINDDIKRLDATLLDSSKITSGKILIVSDYTQFIVNKHSTKRYLKYLNDLNLEYPL